MSYQGYTILFIMLFFLNSCKEKSTSTEITIPSIPVETSQIQMGNIAESISLNGKTTYLNKNKIIVPVAGYITQVNAQYGQTVSKGDILFQIETKENIALDNHQDAIKVRASSAGTIMDLLVNQTGTYVTEGDFLCTIVDDGQLIIEINVPFEYSHELKPGKSCKVFLPDQTQFDGKVYNKLPFIDDINQTQKVLLKPDLKIKLPENLNVIVGIELKFSQNTLLVPKQAILTNEKQEAFWVVKLFNDSLAVKIPIIKGIENDSLVEVISDELKIHDLIISKGAYSLPDSAIVQPTK